MKLSKLVGDRFKERPANCLIDSHALMVRGGYIKNVANGIYSQFPPMKRISQKIENIIRDEMDKLDGQEVLFPVALPGSLWEESGRYESVGSELLRFTDRTGSKMVLGMTHEEASVQLVREYANSYAKYPFMIYQIQTKFRDEARPRAGLIRVREFTMKDAYSFHTSQEDLEQYYQKVYDAYSRIFARCGIPEVAIVKSDSGMMGGSISHEYMLLTPVGEDSIAICPECGYSANVEAAPSIIKNENKIPKEELKEVVKAEVMEEVKSEVREEVKSEVREEIKSEMREEVKSIVINQVIKKVKKSKTLETIASELEEEEADIKPIYDAVVSSAPDYDINVIKDRLDNM